ncbi:hypothetical protein SUGI_1127620 [Cryptomeria japonica]|nr:hypothetical protein SUGI_1127620 [Cryptomeria japonica]
MHKTVHGNKMLFVDDNLQTDKSATSSILYLTGKTEQQQERRLFDKIQNKDDNIGLTERAVLGKWNAKGSERNQCIELKEVLKADIGLAFVMCEISSYWLSKCAHKRGLLLQKIQQEETSKSHVLFTEDSAGIREYLGLKEDLSVQQNISHEVIDRCSQRITQDPKFLDHSSDATVKQIKGLEVENAPSSRTVTSGVCCVPKTEVVRDIDSECCIS